MAVATAAATATIRLSVQMVNQLVMYLTFPINIHASSGAGPLARDTAVTQTAAAMLAWFGQALSQPIAGKQQHNPAAAATSCSTALQSITAGTSLPLAAAGLQAAAAAAVATAPGACSTEDGEQQAADGAGSYEGPKLAADFERWVTSAGEAFDVDFRIKG
jgi:hypothetical protein